MKLAYDILPIMEQGGRKAAGFTLFETMIVLAVTGGLFVIIAATLGGRQNSAEFIHSIQGIQIRLQQIIDQTSAGYFPQTNNFVCNSSGPNTIQITAGSNSQGTNRDCVFLGKVVQFGVVGTNPEQYRIYTIAGSRSGTIGAGSPFQNSNPTVVGVNYAGSDAGLLSYSLPGALQYGLTTLWMRSGGTNIGAVGFLMEPGSLDAITGKYNSGGQPVDLIPIVGTSLGQSLHSTANITNTTLNSPGLAVNPSAGVQICFVSGSTNQSGLVTIGGSGRQLVVNLDIKGNKTCT